MTCAAQAVELLADRVRPGESLLDAGCGSGYFFHSLTDRGIEVDYHGVDASEALIDIGRREMPAHALPAGRLRALRIEDLDGAVDHVLCMNVLSNADNMHRPLERLAGMARRSLVLRESIAERSEYRYVRDEFLDPGVDLRVHVNTYAREEVTGLLESLGFTTRVVTDRRTGGSPESVIGYDHHWTFVVADRSPG